MCLISFRVVVKNLGLHFTHQGCHTSLPEFLDLAAFLQQLVVASVGIKTCRHNNNATQCVFPLCSPPPVKFVIPWPEITRLERVSTGLMPEAIRVSTRQRQRDFSMFLSLDEAFGVISQLADIALRRLLDSEGLELDRVLQQPARITKR